MLNQRRDMPNDYFQFKRFTVRHDRCAMKVGTDGTLLGAWASGGRRILDIGTGTGLIALMMAQRFAEAELTGIDIDSQACQQARENVEASPFSDRIDIREGDVRLFSADRPYDAIVSNPPFFVRSLECPDEQRTQARHATSLSYSALMQSAWRLLADDGCFSLVVPADCKSLLEGEAVLTGFFKQRECAVKTTPRKLPRRYLLSFGKHSKELERSEGIIETSPNVRSEWYQQLTKDFYL